MVLQSLFSGYEPLEEAEASLEQTFVLKNVFGKHTMSLKDKNLRRNRNDSKVSKAYALFKRQFKMNLFLSKNKVYPTNE
ncbi:unnamed protein product [Auanema sp. JU1783]|nr:unnamed protein product [Auanema sp. JU1783]